MQYTNIPHPQDNNHRCPSKIISFLLSLAQNDSSFKDKLDELERMFKSGQTPVVLYNRTQYVYQALKGKSINDIAASMSVCTRTVATWIGRFVDSGAKGLYDKPRKGRPVKFTKEVEDVLDSLLLVEPSSLVQEPYFENVQDSLRDQTEWNSDLLSKIFHVSKSTAASYLKKLKKLNGGSLSYCNSNDPNLPLKSILIDLIYRVGEELGYDVYCFDEKPCVQAIHREFCLSATGQINRSDRYVRAGCTNVLGLLEYANGKLELGTSAVKDTTAIVNFLKDCFSQPERQGRKAIIVMDNISNHGCVQEILESELPVKVVYTGTNSSWQNLIEAYFSKLQKQAIANKSFDNVASLEAAIHAFQQKHNAEIDSKADPSSPNWKANVPKIMINRIKLALYHAAHLPKDFSILADGFSIGLAAPIECAIGSMARELYYCDNILHGIVAHPEFFTEDLVRLASELLDKPLSQVTELPAFAHALAPRREQCLKEAFSDLDIDFSSKVYEAYQNLDKAGDLIKVLMSLFNQPSRAKATRTPKLNLIKQSQVALDNDLMFLEAKQREFDKALLMDSAKLNQLEQDIAKQQKAVAKRQSKLSQLQQSWDLAVKSASPYLQDLRRRILQRLIVSLKECQLDPSTCSCQAKIT